MLNIAICDDSKDFIEVISYKIRSCLKDKFNLECKISCFNELSAFQKCIENNKIDIIFLDIMVNDTNAMDWSISNIHNNYTQIIFMTSFPQCAYNISETNCCYYLVKSRINEEILSRALQRALQKITKKDPNFINVKLGSKNISVNQHDILYIETFNDNIMLHINSSENISVYSSLKDFSENLPPNFLRCHKSYMVNMNHIKSYEPHKFMLTSGDTIPIPPKKYNAVISQYNSYLRNI